MNLGNFIMKDQVLTGKVIQKGDSVQDWSLLVGGYSSTCRYSIRYLLVLHEYVLPVFRRVCLESYFGRATPPPPSFRVKDIPQECRESTLTLPTTMNKYVHTLPLR